MRVKLQDSNGNPNYFVPFSNGLLRPPHVERIGPALFLFVLFEDLVTVGDGTDGLVQGGKPVSDVYLAETLGLHRRTVAAYRRRLESHEYIRTIRTGSGYIVRVMKSKKWAWRQQLGPKNGQERWLKSRPEMSVSETEMSVSTTERSQKVPSRSDKAVTKRDEADEAAASAERVWNLLGFNGPRGIPAFQEILCFEFTHRNGEPDSEVLERALQKCQSSKISIPRPIFEAKRRLEELEHDLVAIAPKVPTVRDNVPRER
jgi:hypothetical protein